jgi:ABC-type branched-subunit amino acid transport system substrate-binding protein
LIAGALAIPGSGASAQNVLMIEGAAPLAPARPLPGRVAPAAAAPSASGAARAVAADPCADHAEACRDARRKLSEDLKAASDVAGGQAAAGGARAEKENTPAPPAAYGGLREAAAATDLRFGMIVPLSGANKEFGAELKLGAETAFAAANEAGGVNGRALKVFAADDGYDPARTPDVLKSLVDKERIFGCLSNFGTPTSASILPYVLEHKLIFFGAFSGAGVLRRDPPDRYVSNYRASYAEETEAATRYLIKVRRIAPAEIAVFAQDDAFGESGYAGVEKAMRALNEIGSILHLRYPRNTIDVASAIEELSRRETTRTARGKKIGGPHIKAVIMVATYRAAAKFVEKAREQFPELILTNVSAVGSNNFAEELRLLGPRYIKGIVVTQVVPDPNGYSSIALEFKNALIKYFPLEHPDYVAFESYINAKILIEGLKRAGPAADSDKVVAGLESIHGWDIGLGATINFSVSEHQAVHKVWGTQLDENGTFKPIDLE